MTSCVHLIWILLAGRFSHSRFREYARILKNHKIFISKIDRKKKYQSTLSCLFAEKQRHNLKRVERESRLLGVGIGKKEQQSVPTCLPHGPQDLVMHAHFCVQHLEEQEEILGCMHANVITPISFARM